MYTSRRRIKSERLLKKAGSLLLAVFLFFGTLPTGLAAHPAPVVQGENNVLSNKVQAAASFSGEETVRSHQKIELKPGAAITFIIKFKNTGSATWRNGSANFVALATVDPVKRESDFKHAFWNEVHYRPGRLLEASVVPGQTGTFRFALQAPTATGDYEEIFQAVAKNLDWITGTKFTIPLKVTTEFTKPKVETPPANTNPISVDYYVRDASYKAKWVGTERVVLTATPGQQLLETFEVVNAGTNTWKNSGYRYASLYTVRPNYHPSEFFSNGPGWVSKDKVRVASDVVKPGETAKVTVMLQAPDQAGVYKETLRLAIEDYSWIHSGELEITIDVKEPSQETTEPTDTVQQGETGPSDQEKSIYRDETYEAKYLVSSHKEVILNPGETTTFQVGFKNIGEKVWQKLGSRFVSMYTIEPNYRDSRFARKNGSLNSGWLGADQVAMVDEQNAIGHLGFFRFDITAPTTPGVYVEKFRLAVEDWTWIKGGEFSLAITVKGAGETSVKQPGSSLNYPIELGPLMRVGVTDSEDAFVVTADTPFEVRSGNGGVLGSLSAKSPVRIFYDKTAGTYQITATGINRTQTDYVIVQALDADTITEIVSLEKRVPWNPVHNENLFRGSIEIRHSAATGKTWAINVLPMEHYLRGIAETSSSSPVEFLKVMTVAARTYATYHYDRQTKHADENFYVDSQYDQVYRGYDLETRHPSLTEAVQATIGQVVMYTDPQTAESKLAITPYFSQSDGRTRDWSEVWGGEVPWAKSVPVPHDVGRVLKGHGVGMSARGALLMVDEDGKTYDQVLKYFFTGIHLEDRY